MTGWIITAVILALIAGVLLINLSARFSFHDNDPLLRVGALGFWFQVYPQKKKKPKKQRKKKVEKTEQPEEKQPQKQEKPKEKLDFDLIMNMISSGGKGLRVLVRHLNVRFLSLHIVAGNEDAAECALLYGKISAAVYTGLAVAENIVSIRKRDISLRCDFDAKQTRVEAQTQLSIRVIFVLEAACCMLLRFVANTIKNSKYEKQEGVSNE